MRQKRREHNRHQKQTLSPSATVPPAAAQGSDTGSTTAPVTEKNQEESQPSGDMSQSTPEGEQGSNGHATGAQAGEAGEPGPLDISMESPSTQEEAPATPEVSHSVQEVEAEAVPGQKEADLAAPPAAAASPQQQSPDRVQSFLLKSLLNVKTQGADVLVEMHWVEGQNKDLMNQLCTCLKNTILRTAASPLS